jgi:NAD(P)H-dependent FMN reductase
MAERGRYSLKELLYWLTVWSVALSALVAVIPEPIGVIFFAAWFIGTTVANKTFGYRAGLWYSGLFGIFFCLLMVVATTGVSNPAPPPRYGLFVLLFGIGPCLVVWAVGIGFDKLLGLLSRSNCQGNQYLTESPMEKILAFAGSTRRDSFNKKLIRVAAEAARQAGGEVTLIDLADFPLPLYDGDLETASGQPENSQRLYELFKSHQALLLSCPEYNSSITAVLKNVIDWVSRPRPGEPELVAFNGKVAALLSASPGGFGGMRGLVHVRAILGNIGTLVIPSQVAVAKANEAFNDDGSLRDEKLAQRIAKVAKELAVTTRKVNSD